ncbi:hypothetical protein LBMAG53_22440 [Planctomycetota bacterium]|nr:hypothetical protein LBMAG53_22440 [Planctomycetota bacterium]
MRRLGHHLYTSLGGQRTVFCSAWLAGWRAWLERRAGELYGEPGSFDIVQVSGLWVAGFVQPNGVDHVGRPRQLVHQIVLEATNAPAIFSPLLLRHALLGRLDHDDPGIEHRLINDLDRLDWSAVMPTPQDFPRILRGPARPALRGLLRAQRHPGTAERIQLTGLSDHLADLAAGSCAVLMHGQAVRICALAALRPEPDAGVLPTVHLTSGGTTRMHSDRLTGMADAEDWLDLIANAGQPHRVLQLLRQADLTRLLDPVRIAGLRTATSSGWPGFDRDGTVLVQPSWPQAGPLLVALLAVGAEPAVRSTLSRWRPTRQNSGVVDIAGEAALNEQLRQPTAAGIAALIRRLIDSGVADLLAAAQPDRHR